jgi:septal ring factor EnvC (AmiA/AmiB activator)
MENEKTVIPVPEFCELYKMPKSTVYRKIKEHAELELSGHIIKKGKKFVFLDDFAVRFLCPQVVPVKTLDDQFSEIRRAIEDRQKEAAGIKEDVSKMAEELTALTTVFNDSRKLTDEKLELALIKTAVTDDKISAAMEQFASLQNSIQELIIRLTSLEEKVGELSTKKGLFGRT